MPLLSMTFHESYGELPSNLLRIVKRHNVSQADYDAVLASFGKSYSDSDIPWQDVLDFILTNVENGSFRLPIYM